MLDNVKPLFAEVLEKKLTFNTRDCVDLWSCTANVIEVAGIAVSPKNTLGELIEKLGSVSNQTSPMYGSLHSMQTILEQMKNRTIVP